VADPCRPVLCRPAAVRARARPPGLSVRGPDAALHRPDDLPRGPRRRGVSRHRPAHGRAGFGRGPGDPRRRPGVVHRRAGARGGDSGARGRPAHRGRYPRGERGHRAPAQRPGADLSADRRRARPDDRRRDVSLRGLDRRRAGAVAARGRRRDPPRRRRRAHLRLAQRHQRLPAPGAPGADGRRAPRRVRARAPAPVGRAQGRPARGRRGRPGGRLGAAAAAAAAGRRRGGRGADAGARGHRAAPHRAGAADQGRHDPRDPPPRQEQPADGGLAAAPARAAPGLQRGPRGAGRERPPHVLDRPGPRDPVPGVPPARAVRPHRPAHRRHARRRLGRPRDVHQLRAAGRGRPAARRGRHAPGPGADRAAAELGGTRLYRP